MPTRPRFSLIIPARNAEATLRRALPGLGRPGRRNFEVIVVDDASTDGTAGLAGRYADRVIRLKSRRGPAGARNAGARAARSGILFFLDADVQATRRALALGFRALLRDPGLAAVFGSYDDRPPEKNFLSQFKNLFQHYVHQNAADEAVTFWAGCGAIRRKAFRAVGGFAETYGAPSIEDVELGYRLRAAGYRIGLLKSLQVTHWKRWTLSRLLRSDIRGRAVPWTRLAWARGLPRDLNFRFADRLSGLLTGLLLASLGGAVLRPVWAAPAAGSAVLLLVLNRRLYGFFLRQRGAAFAAASVLWHWFYLLYSSAVFVLWTPAALLHRLHPRTAAGD
jgi:GT2 family glycosyltransferase